MVRVSVVEYGVGNVRSVVNALVRVGADVSVAENGAALRAQDAARVVLPGVGAVGEALQNLRARGFEDALDRLVRRDGTPFLGICVGMQVLLETCEEFGEHKGFNWIPGTVSRLAPEDDPLRLPHVGWNEVEPVTDDPLLADSPGEHFYFLHSYAVDCPDRFITGRASYGRRFAAALRSGNIAAVQFHPEKSSGAGETVLRAFVGS